MQAYLFSHSVVRAQEIAQSHVGPIKSQGAESSTAAPIHPGATRRRLLDLSTPAKKPLVKPFLRRSFDGNRYAVALAVSIRNVTVAVNAIIEKLGRQFPYGASMGAYVYCA